jgi:hypothetical protein
MRLNHNLGWTVVASHRNTIGSTAWASRASGVSVPDGP